MKKCSLFLSFALFFTSFQMVWADEATVNEEPISNLTLEEETKSETKGTVSEETIIVSEDTSAVSEELPHDFYRAGKAEESDNVEQNEEEKTEEDSEDVENKNLEVKKQPSVKKEPFLASSKKSSLLQKFIQYKNRNTSASVRSEIAESVLKASEKYNIRSSLITAVIWQESTFYPKTKTGPCYGLMQLHSAYSGLSVSQMYHIPTNIDRGTAELASNLKRYKGNETLALTAYNQGIGNVARGNYSTKYARSVLAREQKVIDFLNR